MFIVEVNIDGSFVAREVAGLDMTTVEDMKVEIETGTPHIIVDELQDLTEMLGINLDQVTLQV